MFAFATTPPIASGKVVDVSGVPIAQREVTLVVDDHTLKTFTDLHGDFRFYGRPADRKTPPRESPGSRNFRGMIDKGPAKRLAPLASNLRATESHRGSALRLPHLLKPIQCNQSEQQTRQLSGRPGFTDRAWRTAFPSTSGSAPSARRSHYENADTSGVKGPFSSPALISFLLRARRGHSLLRDCGARPRR